mmetsp:Transcript_3500/g.10865  ORF Transcript_3500/g.10865 Transcript_3500/m.10865 type:complete len:204 (-) Transcript_3500:784-1395(-)
MGISKMHSQLWGTTKSGQKYGSTAFACSMSSALGAAPAARHPEGLGASCRGESGLAAEGSAADSAWGHSWLASSTTRWLPGPRTCVPGRAGLLKHVSGGSLLVPRSAAAPGAAFCKHDAPTTAQSNSARTATSMAVVNVFCFACRPQAANTCWPFCESAPRPLPMMTWRSQTPRWASPSTCPTSSPEILIPMPRTGARSAAWA